MRKILATHWASQVAASFLVSSLCDTELAPTCEFCMRQFIPETHLRTLATTCGLNDIAALILKRWQFPLAAYRARWRRETARLAFWRRRCNLFYRRCNLFYRRCNLFYRRCNNGGLARLAWQSGRLFARMNGPYCGSPKEVWNKKPAFVLYFPRLIVTFCLIQEVTCARK